MTEDFEAGIRNCVATCASVEPGQTVYIVTEEEAADPPVVEALAASARDRGGDVHVVSGPVIPKDRSDDIPPAVLDAYDRADVLFAHYPSLKREALHPKVPRRNAGAGTEPGANRFAHVLGMGGLSLLRATGSCNHPRYAVGTGAIVAHHQPRRHGCQGNVRCAREHGGASILRRGRGRPSAPQLSRRRAQPGGGGGHGRSDRGRPYRGLRQHARSRAAGAEGWTRGVVGGRGPGGVHARIAERHGRFHRLMARRRQSQDHRTPGPG